MSLWFKTAAQQVTRPMQSTQALCLHQPGRPASRLVRWLECTWQLGASKQHTNDLTPCAHGAVCCVLLHHCCCRLAIGDLGTQYFADRGIFCAGRVPDEDLQRVAKATGAKRGAQHCCVSLPLCV